jgi:CO/xanthine dehydrogenase FAD-binding subunit
MQHRIEASQHRTHTKDWKTERRQRTRHLIELGGLVQKAGLVELADDDRAVLLGALLRIADLLRSDGAENAVALWRRRGKRAFDDGTVVE